MPRMQAGRGDAEREGGFEQWLLQLRWPSGCKRSWMHANSGATPARSVAPQGELFSQSCRKVRKAHKAGFFVTAAQGSLGVGTQALWRLASLGFSFVRTIRLAEGIGDASERSVSGFDRKMRLPGMMNALTG